MMPGSGAGRWALGEGENLLAQGSVGHNYLHFYELAMEAAIVHGDWQDAGRYAGLLEGYTHIEALPWSDFCVARARALARCGKEGRAGSESLQRLIDEARQTGLKQSLPALEEALNSARI